MSDADYGGDLKELSKTFMITLPEVAKGFEKVKLKASGPHFESLDPCRRCY